VWYALILGTVLNVATIIAALVNPKAWPTLGAVMIFDVLVIVAAAIGVYTLGRAKLIANSKVLSAGVKGIADAVSNDFTPNEWEHGDPHEGDL
jgi:hypothetical protein